MNVFIITTGIFFSVISAAILSYISMATMVGPWIAPMLVLLTSLLMKLRKKKSMLEIKQEIIAIQAIAAGGGIIAVGVGFALPVLYFLDQHIFTAWIQNPPHFCQLISGVCLAAGSLGIFLGRCFAPSLVDSENLPFPVSRLTYQVMIIKSQLKQTISMFAGFFSAVAVCFFRDGIQGFAKFIPRTMYFFQGTFGTIFEFSIWPTLWAIGFTIGPKIVSPLLVGLASRYLVLIPLNGYFFPSMTTSSFITAFCSGLVLSELILGILHNPTFFYKRISHYVQGVLHFPSESLSYYTSRKQGKQPTEDSSFLTILSHVEPLFALVSSIALLWYLNFSIPAQIALIVFTSIATYEISYIGSEIGLLQLGRFSAFVLIPMMLLFNLNFIQITAICVFFNICAATASDLLFDYKTGSFCSMKRTQLHAAQWIGLFATSLSIGIILYLLFTHLKLGSAQLFAARGQSRALLVKSLNLDIYVVSLGFLYGIILKKLKISPTMTFGGIIMPNRITFGLTIGGLLSLIPKNKEKYIPFCSGVFASEALWVLLSILLNLL